MKRCAMVVLGLCFLCLSPAMAKVDLVALPQRDAVQVTIYNAADLTLVRENRQLTLNQGMNTLQFSWAGTLIDPTSLDMSPVSQESRVTVQELTYPPRARNVGVWKVRSENGGDVPVEISYLASGLTWRAFYMGTLSRDETEMNLKGFVRVSNQSGDDYDQAQFRVVVGKVNLLDQIASLAQRQDPYGRPAEEPELRREADQAGRRAPQAKAAFMQAESLTMARPKEIVKEGISEYFLYTIEGTETVRNGWSKRLPSFETQSIPVVNMYKYDEQRFGTEAIRFLSLANDEEHHLGQTPIPGGEITLFRALGDAAELSFEGQTTFKYIPVGEEAELNLGSVSNVMIEPSLMDFSTDAYLFDNKGNISGWDESRTFRIKAVNARAVPVKIEITRHVSSQSWEIQGIPDHITHEKIDMDTVRFYLDLEPGQESAFEYTVTTHHGQRVHQARQ